MDLQADENAHFDNLSLPWIRKSEAVQCLMNLETFVVIGGDGQIHEFKLDTLRFSAVPDALLAAGSVHQDASHGLGRRTKKMFPPTPLLPV